MDHTEIKKPKASSYEMDTLPDASNPAPAPEIGVAEAPEQSSIAVEPQEGVNIQELPPVDRGRRAWMFCISGFILEMMVWGFASSYGIFQEYYSSHPPFNKASNIAIASVGTAALALQYGEVLILSFTFTRHPEWLQKSLWIGLVIYFVSLFSLSFATQIWQLIFLQGVGVGVGGGLLYMPIIKLLPEWFSERRGLAGGIIYAGKGVGGFIFPLILNVLLEKVGLRWTLRVWAIGTSVLAGIAILGMRSRLPIPKFTRDQRRPKFIPPQLTVINNRLFWSLISNVITQGLSYFPVSLYIATFASLLSDPLTATIVLALFNLSAVVGTVVLGTLSDRFPYAVIMTASELGAALGALFLWGFAKSPVSLYFFAIIFGALSGGSTSTWPNAAAECARGNPEYINIAYSTMSFFKGISAVVGPIIAGLLLQSGKGTEIGNGYGRFGYGAVELFVGSCALASGVAGIAAAISRRRVLS